MWFQQMVKSVIIVKASPFSLDTTCFQWLAVRYLISFFHGEPAEIRGPGFIRKSSSPSRRKARLGPCG
jgi:hypothetical protein